MPKKTNKSHRELIDTGTDKRFVRRDEKGQFEDVGPGGRNFKFVDSFQLGVCQPAVLGLVAKASFGSAESFDPDVLETFDISH